MNNSIRAVISILFVIVSFSGFGQSQEISDLLNATRRASAYPDSLAYYGEKLLNYNDSLAKFEGYFAVGYSHYLSGKLNTAGTYYDSALVFANPAKHATAYSRIKRNRAIVYQRTGNVDQARSIYTEMLNNAKENNIPVEEALMLHQLGILEQSSGNYDQAAANYNSAIALYKENRPAAATNSMINLGTLYGRMDLIPRSNSMLKEAVVSAETYGQTTLSARAFNNISVNFRKVGQLDSSNHYLSLAETIYTSQGNKISLIENYQNKTANFIELNQKDSAYHYLNKALVLNEGSGDKYRESRLDFMVARVELAFGNAEKAIEYANLSISKILELQSVDDLNDRYQILADAYEKAGQEKLALQIMRKWKALDDSLEFYKNVKTLEELTQAYDAARNDELIEEAAGLQKMNTGLLAGIGAVVVLSAFLFFQMKKKSKEVRLKSSEIATLQTQVNLLKDQLKPTQDYITLKSKAVIPIEELMYIQSDGPYIELFTEKKERPEIDRNSLKSILASLPHNQFIQVHRSYIVNINFIQSIYATNLVLKDGTELNISRTFKSGIESVLRNTA
ncbi:LytTR family transcriptional regulator DNA-binding domain-containing protein [Roseivirga pacifica]|uniref:LytTR family transcriptional regulator DNA-binding domain-containing protein n=1 Tax=Roseivirga pacifica TaxID=1267423 RepID=UPI00209402DA|nr:LytTR family transcriptional regulator DNA-binding domain-containing protein [Roseivirga pacifica]MCO6359904.1 hypothetical protein [Roseivirga pacifica]MCO6367274.1 hypothetical protein [Roseivirga pacifica]MCO6370194.1 hypothetical protein [Roseivirga pacifica]MCO6374931.1 hypothetical protein [Roseivirga pacifica]MCO6380189.1 hypothetical protein [Roseivirga pacifica]